MKKNYVKNETSILLNFDDACEFLTLKKSKVRNMVFKNEIPVLRIGRLLRFDKNDLIKWIESKKQYRL